MVAGQRRCVVGGGCPRNTPVRPSRPCPSVPPANPPTTPPRNAAKPAAAAGAIAGAGFVEGAATAEQFPHYNEVGTGLKVEPNSVLIGCFVFLAAVMFLHIFAR